MAITLRVAKAALPTGQLLARMLRERGVEVVPNGDAIVSYGVAVNDPRPALNANAGRRNKFEELTRLREQGVVVPNFSQDGVGLTFPVLGRKFTHSKARDIVPILQNDKEFEWRKNGGACDYFVQYIPRNREFRVWAYRRRILAVYEKIMRYPDRYRVGKTAGIGWNWDHGFAFVFLPKEQRPEGLEAMGAAAVAAMELDFGAVDAIQAMDGTLYALECNSAPGVQGPRQGLDVLANKIQRWEALGYPRRNNAQQS